eukprot:TRINITY_DN12272_c0_g2_i2.p1 TRINITY_DN12272_c0_g2~~TRINITY_DN12272_c0_g2_i2.p1  ORF type:complete len:340 (+),score=73.05 TRINITY_DN12272_c0_g2_i2:60-1022(+)
MTDTMPTEEGYIYGRQKQEPADPPDLPGLFDAANIPEKTGGIEGLPHSPEWYAGAKDREKIRAAEFEKMLVQKASLRKDWADLVGDGLTTARDRLDMVMNLAEPLSDLKALVARTKHERPGDAGTFNSLHEVARLASIRQDKARQELRDIMDGMSTLEGEIKGKEAADAKAEEDRLEEKRLADKRRRKNERMLKRQEALVRGEDPGPLVEDSDEEPGQKPPEDDLARLLSPQDESRPSTASSLPASAVGGRRKDPLSSPETSPAVRGSRPHSENRRVRLSDDLDASPGHSPSTSPPPLQRSGISRELPPLDDPPIPPDLA